MSEKQYIKNPTTNRAVLVNGRVWHQLVNRGLINGHNNLDEKDLGEVKEDYKKQIEELSADIPINKEIVKGRGRYSGKLTTRYKKPSTKEIVKLSQKVVKENSDIDDDELERMILEEINTKPRNRVLKNIAEKHKYKVVEPVEESDDESDEDSEEDDDEGDLCFFSEEEDSEIEDAKQRLEDDIEEEEFGSE